MAGLEHLLGIDLLVDGRCSLERHRELYPANLQVIGYRAPEDLARTQRLRLRELQADLETAGLTVSGVEPSRQCSDPDVRLEGQLHRDGSLHHQRLRVYLHQPDPVRLTQVQAALHQHGWPAVVTLTHSIEVPQPEQITDLEELGWWELDTGTRPPDVVAVEMSRWIDLHHAFREYPWSVQGWLEAGQDPQAARPWLEANGCFADYELVTRWQGAGFRPEQAGPWLELAPVRPQGLVPAQLHDMGLTPEQGARWQQLLGDLGGQWSLFQQLHGADLEQRQLQELVEAGAGLEQARQLWSSLHYGKRPLPELLDYLLLACRSGRPEEFRRLLASELSAARAQQWLEAMPQLRVDLLPRWERSGIEPALAARWRRTDERFVPTPDRLGQWLGTGLEPAAARPWLELQEPAGGMVRLGEWIEAGYTSEQTASWLQRQPGISAETAVAWRDTGWSQAEIQGWLDARVIRAEQAQAWLQLGARSPQQVESLVLGGLGPEQAALVLQQLG